jgi:hypothetical protein
MLFKLQKGYPGDELRWEWLNALRSLARTNRISLGMNSGLEMVQNEANGTILRVSLPQEAVGAWYCEPSSGVTGATGTWPALTAVSFTADVSQQFNGNLTKVASSATIWNGYPASLVANKVCTVRPDGAGDWSVIGQSCT